MLMYLLPNRFVENMYSPYPIMQYGSSLTYTNTCIYYASTSTYTFMVVMLQKGFLFEYEYILHHHIVMIEG